MMLLNQLAWILSPIVKRRIVAVGKSRDKRFDFKNSEKVFLFSAFCFLICLFSFVDP